MAVEARGPSQADPAEPAEASHQQEGPPQEMNLGAISEMIASQDASALQQMAQHGNLPFQGLGGTDQPAEQLTTAPVSLTVPMLSLILE